MKKTLLTTLIGATVLTLYSGCSNPSLPDATQESASHSKSALYTQMHNDKKLKQLVIKAAKEKGWRVTNLSDKTIVAENFDSDKPIETTISIRNGVVDFDYLPGIDESKIVDLREYIEDLIKAQQEGY